MPINLRNLLIDMFSLLARYALNVFYYIGGFFLLGIAYFCLYNSNVIVYRILKAVGISKGRDRQFKSIAEVRADMGVLIDSLYTLADSTDVLLKMGIRFANSWWSREIESKVV
jgi:hypothetical protein